MKKTLTRGQRNNNPFNIKDTTIDWKGENGKNNDPVFEEFISLEYGLRAGMLLLRNYIRKGYNSIGSIISRFAPSQENDTVSYIDFVSSNTRIHHDSVIKENSDEFFKVCKAILRLESQLTIDTKTLKNIYKKHGL